MSIHALGLLDLVGLNAHNVRVPGQCPYLICSGPSVSRHCRALQSSASCPTVTVLPIAYPQSKKVEEQTILLPGVFNKGTQLESLLSHIAGAADRAST